MGFLDNVKKAFGSKKEENSSKDSESSISKHDVFISYSTKDSEIANKICHVLEQNKLKCWIPPRDITSGRSYIDEISEAIMSTKIVVLVFSKHSQESKYSNNEINLAFSYKKPIFSFDIDNSLPKEDMQYNLKVTQWLSAYPNQEDGFETLIMEALKWCHGEKPFSDENLKHVIQHQNSEDNFINDKVIEEMPTKKIRNFKYLDDLIHSGVKEIVLDSDIILSDDEKSKYSNGIKLDVDELVIDGNGCTIDARRKTSIFLCTGKNILIKNVILENGSSNSHHGVGAIENNGELTIKESTLNKNEGGLAGGILNFGELTLIKSILAENKAKNTGGIFNFIGKLTIIGSVFQENIGTVTKAISNNNGEMTITESKIVQNKKSKLLKPLFGNKVIMARHGGVISNGGNLKIFNCEISSNKSKHIILNAESLIIYNTIFKDNETQDIILNDNYEHTGLSSLGIFNCEFIDNNAKESVVYNDGEYCTIERTIFDGNILHKNSNNIVNKSELTLKNLKIKDNGKTILNDEYIFIREFSPKIESKIYGKGLVKNIKDIISNEQNFDFGYLDKKIHESKNKEIILDHDITFENYEIDFYEGGIELDIDNLVIDGNGHTIDGSNKSRIFIITGKNIKLKNITFKNGYIHKDYNNIMNNQGGAIRTNYNSSLTIEKCKFLNNVSRGGGGAIQCRDEVDIIKTLFTSNTVKRDGGGAIHNDGKLNIMESTLINNMAQRYGGAICNGGSLSIVGSTLTNNMARSDFFKSIYGKGGAIYNNEGKLTIAQSALNNNTSNSDGGAIRNSDGEMVIIESTLNNNIAQWVGGAICNSNGVLTITKSTLQENNDRAIDNYGGKLTIIESTLSGNTSKSSGGAIKLLESKYESNDCTFKDNKPDDVYEK